MRKIETYGSVTGGRLNISYRNRFTGLIRQMDDCRVLVTVEKLYRKRSSEQNGYYWGVVVHEFQEGYLDMTGEQIGKDQAHELLKQRCNYREVVNEATGEVLKVGMSTAGLTTIQMSEYWERCRGFILEFFNRRVPEPNEQVELEFNVNP